MRERTWDGSGASSGAAAGQGPLDKAGGNHPGPYHGSGVDNGDGVGGLHSVLAHHF